MRQRFIDRQRIFGSPFPGVKADRSLTDKDVANNMREITIDASQGYEYRLRRVGGFLVTILSSGQVARELAKAGLGLNRLEDLEHNLRYNLPKSHKNPLISRHEGLVELDLNGISPRTSLAIRLTSEALHNEIIFAQKQLESVTGNDFPIPEVIPHMTLASYPGPVPKKVKRQIEKGLPEIIHLNPIKVKRVDKR